MKNNCKVLLLFFASFIIVLGCNKNDAEGDITTPVRIMFTGLDVIGQGYKIALSVKVDYKGTSFKSEETGNNLKIGYVSYISVQNSDGELLDEIDFKPMIYEPDFRPQMLYESEYLSMMYLSEESPFEIEFVIKENLSSQKRIITIEYGDKRVFRYTKLTITQDGK